MKIGVFADPHYSLKENDEIRFFRGVYSKLEKIIFFFLKERVDFVICLGDLFDCEGGKEFSQLFENISILLKKCMCPIYFCLGNHDIQTKGYEKIAEWFIPCRDRYFYSFDQGNIHFVILDTNYDKSGKPYTAENMKWDQLYVGEAQRRWLKNDLAQTDKRTIVFTHGNLDYRGRNDGKLNPHVVKDYQEVEETLEKSGKVRIVLQGHDHLGGKTEIRGIQYITLKALVDGEGSTPVLLISTDDTGNVYLKNIDLA